MKRIKLTVLGLLMGIAYINANPVDANVAQKAAENFYTSIHSASITNIALAYTERDQAGVPVYYIFDVNTDAQKGFIIISAEDATHPVIGFSDEGNFAIPANNNNVSFWMQERKNEVIAIRAAKLKATSGITSEWSTYTTANTKQDIKHNVASNTVGPLCGTSWNQSPYYNAYCPGGSVTGCVATAMAQIMRYWKYPSKGTGTHCYSDEQPYFSENYGQQCAEFDTSRYAWPAMQLTPLGDSNNQIAKLMYDCGVSVDMDYTPDGSGAQVMGGAPSAYNSFTQYFGYDADSINTAYFVPNQQSSWIALLESEVNKARPMQFQGFDVNNGGHSWVCDGYYNGATDTSVHMNWGWGGQDNGWYAVNSLNPQPFDFTYNIAIIYGIQPPPDALGVATITNTVNITVYPNPSTGLFNFTLPDNNSYQVQVYNVLGEQIHNSVISSVATYINLGNQPKGVYIYKLFTEKGTPVSTGKLVVE